MVLAYKSSSRILTRTRKPMDYLQIQFARLLSSSSGPAAYGSSRYQHTFAGTDGFIITDNYNPLESLQVDEETGVRSVVGMGNTDLSRRRSWQRR